MKQKEKKGKKKRNIIIIILAIKIGQNLINAALMIHITSDELFSNSRALFRLLDQEVNNYILFFHFFFKKKKKNQFKAWIVHLQMRDPVSGLVKVSNLLLFLLLLLS